MMNHSDVQTNLLLYIDGELPQKDVDSLEAHLRDCSQCRQALQMSQSLWTMEDSLSSTSQSYFAWMRFEQRIAGLIRHPVRNTVSDFLPATVRIAAATAVLCSAFLLGQYLVDVPAADPEATAPVMSQLHLDKFQLPESDPFVNTVVRFSDEFGKRGGR